MSNSNSTIYRIGITWDQQTGCEAHIRDFAPLRIDMPIEFGGGGRHACPHEIFFSSVGSCFLGTFLIFQRQLRVELDDLNISVEGRVDMITEGNDRGKYEITAIEISLYIKAKGDEDDKTIIGDCIRLAEQHCPIKRTMQKAIPITIKSTIETSPG